MGERPRGPQRKAKPAAPLMCPPSGGKRKSRAESVTAKAMEGVKSLERSPDELPGVEGVERSDGGGGNWGGPPRPGGAAVRAGGWRPITGGSSGSGRPAGRESEAAVVPIEPTGQQNRRRGKGRCFVHASRTGKGR